MAKKKSAAKTEEVKAEVQEVEVKETPVKESPKKAKSIIDDLPEGHEFKQVGTDAILIHGNKKVRVTGNLEDQKEHLARVFIYGR